MSAQAPPPKNCYTQWFGTFACSIISIVALTSGFGGSVSAQNGKDTWVFSAFIIAMILSFFAVLAHMVKSEFSGTTTEAGMVRAMASFFLALVMYSFFYVLTRVSLYDFFSTRRLSLC
jgi:hypothetical protein